MQNERYVAAVDLGTGKIAVSVAGIKGEDIQILYYKETPSDGIRNSIIFNPKKASIVLSDAIKAAESELNIKVRQIVTGYPRCNVQQVVASAELKRADALSCISLEEIEELKEQALAFYSLDDDNKEMIYGAVAQSFSADDLINQSEDNIAGTVSDSLVGNFKIFVGSKKAVINTGITANNANVALARQYFIPDVVAKAVLTGDEMENGVALVEMGAGVTSLTIYHNNIMRYYNAIPFGGSSITNDIKYECGFKEKLAENIKLAFGSSEPDRLQSMSDKILQISDDENGSYEQLTIKYLSEIINARASEIIEAILFLIQESGYADKLRDGVVLTGGGANLTDISALFKRLSGYNVRIGFPRVSKFFSSVCPGAGDASAAASIGLILKAKEDSHVNCLDEAPAPKKEEKEEAFDIKGSVFDPESAVEEPHRETKKVTKKNSSITWIRKRMNKAFDNTVGSLYDQMGENVNE
ncbi:MAG: cell division protein FtsA [Bacteroidales bacterium]|nr:cell division protein FtsA [Bacteroidales bacterium]